jgi:transcriptional regulator with XRE-family HTH domain
MSETRGATLRRIRESHKLTATRLAELANVKQEAISRWERNGYGIGTKGLGRIARVLGVTIDAIIFDPAENISDNRLTTV